MSLLKFFRVELHDASRFARILAYFPIMRHVWLVMTASGEQMPAVMTMSRRSEVVIVVIPGENRPVG